jgi:hypothetical protein
MLQENIPLEVIARITGLTIDCNNYDRMISTTDKIGIVK